MSESDIALLAERIDEDFGGEPRCYSEGRVIILAKDVEPDWEPPKNLKEIILKGLKSTEYSNIFFRNNIDVSYYFFNKNNKTEIVRIYSNEFSTFNYSLGEYLSIKDHPKAKGVNLKLKVPVGWDVMEGDRPNVVKKFIKDDNTFLILIKENVTFFSRNESKQDLQESDVVNGYIEDLGSVLNNLKILDQSVMTIDTYPSLQFKVKGTMERAGLTITIIMRQWVIFFEDKIVFLQSGGTSESIALDQLYFQIMNSVIFPEQYN